MFRTFDDGPVTFTAPSERLASLREMNAPSPRWTLVLNGKAAADGPLREAVAAMRARGVALSVRVTWERGDAGRIVDEALAAGADVLVAAGGDGTLSAVATALAGRDAGAGALPAVGLVPLGTANDFATAAGIPPAPLAALELVAGTRAQPVDLLRILAADGEHWCANLASGGFGTAVTVETDEGLKKMLGGLAYLLTGIARLGRIEPSRARFSGVDGEGRAFAWEGEFIAVGLGNARQAGGGQALCPDARIDDGLLDLTIVPELSGELAATVGTLLAEGRHAALERIAVRARLARVRVESPAPLVLNLDGEPVESARFEVECVPARLRMHLPEDCPLRGAAATLGP
jgi:lipid kinase YegS